MEMNWDPQNPYETGPPRAPSDPFPFKNHRSLARLTAEVVAFKDEIDRKAGKPSRLVHFWRKRRWLLDE